MCTKQELVGKSWPIKLFCSRHNHFGYRQLPTLHARRNCLAKHAGTAPKKKEKEKPTEGGVCMLFPLPKRKCPFFFSSTQITSHGIRGGIGFTLGFRGGWPRRHVVRPEASHPKRFAATLYDREVAPRTPPPANRHLLTHMICFSGALAKWTGSHGCSHGWEGGVRTPS